ncbi:MAG: hypothetical protein QOF89_2484 [Acidobacteriota bacterium]|jgi:hypothetical protein|nr:hypothetical protein [Acidobacteriota bacterium]
MQPGGVSPKPKDSKDRKDFKDCKDKRAAAFCP